MRRKIVLTVLLCLATAALGIGAAPALAAATCTDCHAAPPDGPPAPHGVLVAAVTDCATCHKGMSPHPDSASLARPALNLRFAAASHRLSGRLEWIGGRTVYLQQRLWGTGDFTDIAQVTTASGLFSIGNYGYTVPSPTPWVAYRAVAEGGVWGFVGPRTNTPALTVWLPRPTLTLKLSGLTDGSITLGRSVTEKGHVAPPLLTGENVGATVFRLRTGKWVEAKSGTAEIGATGTYTWKYTPGMRGSFRVRAAIAATDNHNAVTTTWRYFKVK